PAYVPAHRRELHAFERRAELEPRLWREAGFLAGWVALKTALGQREEAWSRMLTTHVDDGFWNHVVCETALVENTCPADKTHSVSFPEALEGYLRQTGTW